MSKKINKKQKYVVFWQDHIVLGFVEVSSTKSNAQTVKKVTDNVTPYCSEIMEFKEFINYLKHLREDKEENWTDFSPTPKSVSDSAIDFLYDSFIKISKDRLIEK